MAKNNVFVWLQGGENIMVSIPELHIPKDLEYGAPERGRPPVKWIAPAAGGVSFKIHFKKDTPFQSHDFDTSNPGDVAKVQKDAEVDKVYYYDVTAVDADGNEIAKIDPAVVIDPP